MRRERLKKRENRLVKAGEAVSSWRRNKVLYADDIAVGNCMIGDEDWVGLSMLAKDQSVICHIHVRSDIAVELYRAMGEAIMDAGPISVLRTGSN
jgi:hypothetical protein